jgi:hypothetical protein
VKRESSEALAKLTVMSKGVGRSEEQFKKWALLGGSISAVMCHSEAHAKRFAPQNLWH